MFTFLDSGTIIITYYGGTPGIFISFKFGNVGKHVKLDGF